MELKETTKLYAALSDETRLRLLFLLSHGEFCVQELTEVLDLPQSTVSRHLTILGNVGLVQDRREGTRVYYALATPPTLIHERILLCVRQVFPGFRVLRRDRKRLEAHKRR